MNLCNHGLYNSEIYAKPDHARYYARENDGCNQLPAQTSGLHKQTCCETSLHTICKQSTDFSHSACEIIPQIKFDLDLIEVSDGFCFSVKSRNFIACPVSEAMRRKWSPGAFVVYDCSTPPQPQYFEEGILNSFPDVDVRVECLNKLYQCFLAFKMPQKVRKLVVVGPKDSGKTCWSNIFHRIIPAKYIASITSEKQFSAAMISNETQLVLVDERSSNTMESELAKSILQGGWMISAVRHGVPKTILNNSPYYITANHVPNFGEDDENVKRRIQIFQTKALPTTLKGIDRWIYDHAMDCIAWIAHEINENREYIDPQELWYESTERTPLTVSANEGENLFSEEQIRRICDADLLDEPNEDVQDSVPTIHQSFAAEFRC